MSFLKMKINFPVKKHEFMLYFNRVIFVNKKDFVTSEDNFKYTFEGESEIDAIALTGSINIIVNSFRGITAETEPEAFFKLKIKAMKEGSFSIDIKAAMETARNLLTYDNYCIASSVVDAFITIVKFKNFLKGVKPEKIESVSDNTSKVYNINGDTTIIENSTLIMYTKDEKIDKNISSLFKIAEE